MSKIFKSFFSLIFGTWGICPSPSSISKLCKYLYLWRVGVTKHERGGETWFNTYFSTIIIRRVSQETHGPWIRTWLQLFGSTGYDTFFPLLQQWVACGIPYPVKILFEFVLHRHPLSISCLSTIEKTRVKNIIDIRQIVHTYGWWWRAIAGKRSERKFQWVLPEIK